MTSEDKSGSESKPLTGLESDLESYTAEFVSGSSGPKIYLRPSICRWTGISKTADSNTNELKSTQVDVMTNYKENPTPYHTFGPSISTRFIRSVPIWDHYIKTCEPCRNSENNYEGVYLSPEGLCFGCEAATYPQRFSCCFTCCHPRDSKRFPNEIHCRSCIWDFESWFKQLVPDVNNDLKLLIHHTIKILVDQQPAVIYNRADRNKVFDMGRHSKGGWIGMYVGDSKWIKPDLKPSNINISDMTKDNCVQVLHRELTKNGLPFKLASADKEQTSS